MFAEVEGKVLGTREFVRKDGTRGLVVELYQAGGSDLVRVVADDGVKFKEGELVRLKVFVGRGQKGFYVKLAK